MRLYIKVLVVGFSDSIPMVLTSNIDGYIPLKFSSGQTYHINCPDASDRRTSSKNLTDDTPLKQASLSLGGRDSNGVSDPNTSRTDALKALIINDKTGSALNHLKAMAESKANKNTASGVAAISEDAQPVQNYDSAPEPKKPPRRATAKGLKTNSSSDESDRSSSSAYVDVTMNL